MAIDIVDFPMKNGDFPQLCKRLPGGTLFTGKEQSYQSSFFFLSCQSTDMVTTCHNIVATPLQSQMLVQIPQTGGSSGVKCISDYRIRILSNYFCCAYVYLYSVCIIFGYILFYGYFMDILLWIIGYFMDPQYPQFVIYIHNLIYNL